MKKELTVKLTLEWTFDQRSWSAEKKHSDELKDNPNIVLGYDTINAMHMLNSLDRPKITKYLVTEA
jgi:hypothetical protein|tara:strand:+ start:166 stop:363 length:198 start_codon:yes stop_codon:yes gene_type:complete